MAALELKYLFGEITDAEYAVTGALLRKSALYKEEMSQHVNSFIEWVKTEADGMPGRYVERLWRMDQWVPEGFGTADLVLESENKIHVIDFK